MSQRQARAWHRPQALHPLLAGLLCAVVLGACGQGLAPPNTVRVAAARDVLPLAQAVQDEFKQASGLSIAALPSTDSLQDLTAGRADAVLLGREPDPQAVKDLDVRVVGYDAVCLLMDVRTVEGGLAADINQTPQHWVAKINEFTGLTHQDLQAMLGTSLRKVTPGWVWTGPYFEFAVERDSTDDVKNQAGRYEPTLLDPTQPRGAWVRKPFVVALSILPPGKFDTQAVALQRAGYSDADLDDPKISFARNFLDSEEELISFRFTLDPYMVVPTSTNRFNPNVVMASRRVTLRALQHGFQVRALMLDRVDPLGDPQAIYDGRYLLSRKLYVVTRRAATQPAQTLVQFLLSAPGQKLIAQADYLPLPPGS